MKKILAFTLSIILAGTALAGCGDTNNESEINDTSSISESSETATESATTSEAEKTFFEMYYDLNFTYEATDYYMMFEERFNKFLDEVRNNEKFKNKAKDIGFLHKKFRCLHFSEEDMVSNYEWGIFDIDITRNRDIGIEKITSGAVNYIYSDKYDIETTEDLVLFHLIPYAVVYDYSIDDLIEFRDKLIVNPIKK